MGNKITRLTLDIPNKLHRDFKVLAHTKRRTMRDLALELIEDTVAKATKSLRTWCHEGCRKWAERMEINPIFDNVCHESCTDEACSLEHSDYCD